MDTYCVKNIILLRQERIRSILKTLDRQTERHSTDNKSLYSSRTNSQCQMHRGRACVTTEDNAILIYAQEYVTAYNMYHIQIL